MPTIRVDDEVFEGLKKLAEPFVDSPNAVIRRLLVEKALLQPAPVAMKRTASVTPAPHKALTPDLTPQGIYEAFLLAVLESGFAGRGEKRAVTRAVIDRMVKHGFIGPADLELVATGETRAENTITWGRNALKNRGLVARGSPRGIWELTEEGRAEALAAVLPKNTRG
ncbi:MAG: winged helix-turn-helix domain-containing protein [Betaproteobacteria bacterium]